MPINFNTPATGTNANAGVNISLADRAALAEGVDDAAALADSDTDADAAVEAETTAAQAAAVEAARDRLGDVAAGFETTVLGNGWVAFDFSIYQLSDLEVQLDEEGEKYIPDEREYQRRPDVSNTEAHQRQQRMADLKARGMETLADGGGSATRKSRRHSARVVCINLLSYSTRVVRSSKRTSDRRRFSPKV